MSDRDEAVKVGADALEPRNNYDTGTTALLVLDAAHDAGRIVWAEDALAAIHDPLQGRITAAEIEAKRGETL